MPTQEEILAALAVAKAGADSNSTPEKEKEPEKEPQPPAPVVEAVLEYDELADLHNQANSILSQHGGLLSNVPIDSAYWGLMNRIRSLRNSNA